MTLAPPRPTAPARAVVPVIDRIAAECEVLSADAVRCAGTEVHRPADAPVAGDSWSSATLAGRLYLRYHLGVPGADARPADHRPAFTREDPRLGAALRRANACSDSWEPGWRMVGSDGPDGRVVVRDGLRLFVTRGEVRPFEAPPGSPVEVRFPADRPFASPGFFLTVSSRGPAQAPEGVARWYVAVTAGSAPGLFGAMTSALEGMGVRFVMKVLNDPAEYPRPDAAVVYVPRADVARLAPTVFGVVSGFELQERVPSFARRLAGGLAIADDPPSTGHPMSFGQHRCALVARGLVAAGPGSTPAERRAAVLESFATEGVDPARPHLNPGVPEFDLEEPSWPS
ncbi:UNVERIFIED_ORG: hypothetical protein E4P37_17265 [Bacillus sp. AZ43]